MKLKKAQTRKKLHNLAKEMNENMGLEPEIDLSVSRQNLADAIEENFVEVVEDDIEIISEKNWEFLLSLGCFPDSGEEKKVEKKVEKKEPTISLIWRLWSGGEKDAVKIYEKIGKVGKLQSIVIYLSNWKSGKRLPKIAIAMDK